MELVLSFSLLTVVAWLIFRAVNQRDLLQPLAQRRLPIGAHPDVAVVVPARDEEANLARCLEGLVGQDYPTGRLQILVVDDHSADATLSIARSLAASHPQIKAMRSPPLPPGWIGKSHACWIGARALTADASIEHVESPEWLCFLDADVRTAPGLLTRAVATATAERLDLLSLAPSQELGSFAERLIIPCGLYLLAFCRDLRDVQSRHGKEATATGQFLLVRTAAYRAVGGHAAVHQDICEDLALARLLKQAGRNVVLRDGKGLISARMYTGWRTLWPGFTKNLTEMFGGPTSTLAIAFAAVLLAWAVWLVPLADGLSCGRGSDLACVALAPALIAAAAMIGLHIAGAVHFRIPLWYGLLFPLAYAVGAAMAIDSIRRRVRGRIDWKGRTYR